jgi:L-rhamnose mutarotase
MNPSPQPRRYGMVNRVKPERFEEYKRDHAAVWPSVLAQIARSKITNYSIFHREGWLFSSFLYWGDDFGADMRLMAADPETQRWWARMEPLQDPLPTRAPGEWWAGMEEVFYHEGTPPA